MILDFDILFDNAIAYSKEDHTGARCGVGEIDDIFRLEKGDFLVLCGNPNEGKSTFIQWYFYKMSLANDWKVCYLNFEGKQEEIILQIFSMYKDRETMKRYVSFSEIEHLTNINQVVKDIEDAKKQMNINAYVIDPFSNLLLGNVDTYTIAQDLAKLQEVGRRLGVVIVLLCHPPKNTEEVNIFNIKGSSAFAERADIGISIQRDWESKNTLIKVDKLRANGLRGKVKGETYLQYNNFQFYPIDNNDLPFEKELTKKDDNNISDATPTPPHESPTERQEICLETANNIMVDYYTNCKKKAPQKSGKLIDSINLYNSTDEPTKQHIKHIRELTNHEEIQRYKADNLPCVLPSCRCGANKEEIKDYHNIICIDIDKKDNPQYSIEEIKQIVNKIPYVFYSCVSCSGRGMLALIYLDGGIDQFKPHFYALEKYFKGLGITIDSQCKNVNRLRFVTYDEKPYFNPKALIYTDVAEQPTTTRQTESYNMNKAESDNKQTQINTLTDKEKAKGQKTILDILRKCKRDNIVINPTHDETNKLSLILAKYFNEDGFDKLLQFQAIKHGYYVDVNKYKSTYFKDCTNANIRLSVATLQFLYQQATKNNEEKDVIF